jgi:hypothetical protein
MIKMAALALVIAPTATMGGHTGSREYGLPVLPPERRSVTDSATGAELLFLTTDPATDQALYYEQRSWLADGSMILFMSSRKEGGLMGYLTKSGHLVRITTPTGGLGGATAAARGTKLYACRGKEIVELSLRLRDGVGSRMPAVTARERVLATLPEDVGGPVTALSESADGAMVALGVGRDRGRSPESSAAVITVSTRTGKMNEIARMPAREFSGHVMFSRDDPSMVYYLRAGSFRTVLDARSGKVVFEHRRQEGEYATHHCWWKGPLITFCGGFHLPPTEDGDVKTLNIRTGEVRIVGRGNWWPRAVPRELAACNWWHSAGDEQGRWIAADNWHGDIGLFHSVTTRTRILTQGHRTYGSGVHPEVGWDRVGRQVVFSSHKLGNVDVCVATVPRAWQDGWESEVSRPER